MNLTEVDSIKKFYEGSEVFITGASGFIGKALVEKILRSCPRIKTVYVLLRERKGKTLAERIKDMTDGLLFDTVREENPDAFDKIHAIQGDVSELGLGISDADLEKIKSCSVVFHAAASVRFDDPLKSAIILNTRGTREMCELAKKMPNLRAFLHVSTAYIQPRRLHVEEVLYETDADWRSYIKLAENFDEDLINSCAQKLTEFAPNTYTFTKNLAERVCVDYKRNDNLPIIIYRPSIVSVAESEPFTGWCDNLNGPLGLTIVCAMGINHVMNLAGTQTMNVVPVDLCVKGLLIAAWKYWKDQQNQSTGVISEIPVYNSASIKIISYDSMKYGMMDYVENNPSVNLIGLPSVTFTTCVYYAWIIRIFRNLIPALFLDVVLLIARQKPKILKLNRIIYNAEQSLRYFYTNTFTIENFKFLDLALDVPAVEKDEFSLTEKLSSNTELYENAYKFTLKIAFGETDRDLKIARKRYTYIYCATKAMHAFVLYLSYKLFFHYF